MNLDEFYLSTTIQLPEMVARIKQISQDAGEAYATTLLTDQGMPRAIAEAIHEHNRGNISFSELIRRWDATILSA